MTVLSLSKGVRGCTPSEYDEFFDKIVYFKCIACEYTWEFPLKLYQDDPPKYCPLCNEFKYSAEWIDQEAQPFENEFVPNLSTLQFIIEPVQVPGYTNIYDLTAYPEDFDIALLDSTSNVLLDSTSVFHTFKKKVKLNDPDNVVNEPYFHRDMLTILIDDPELAWKKAYITKEVRLFVED